MKHQPYYVIVYGTLVIGGMVSGILAWLFLPDMLSDSLRSHFAQYFTQLAETATMQEVIWHIFRINFMDLLRIYLCGICLVGIPILVVFLFLKCFSIGFASFILLQSSVWAFCTRVLFIPILLLAALMSHTASKKLLLGKQQNQIHQLVRYTVLYLAVLLFTLLTSILDGIANYYCLQQF